MAARRPSTLTDLAKRLPPGLALGTSSWTFPTWDGLVYARRYPDEHLVAHGLAAYSRHPLFNAVGLDRTFYRPMSIDAMRVLAEVTPDGFAFLVKAHGDLTRPSADRGRGPPNPRFLDPSWARDQVLAPAVLGLGAKLGVVLFQFPSIDFHPAAFPGGHAAFLDRLAGFLATMPASVPVAVEVRNADLLESPWLERYRRALAEHGVEHAYSGHPSMPTVGEQMRRLPIGPIGDACPVVCRWLLHRTQQYEEAKARYFPFQRLVDEDVPTRVEIARLAHAAAGGAGGAGERPGRRCLIIVNNKAEGSAPLSVERLAERIAAGVRTGTSSPA